MSIDPLAYLLDWLAHYQPRPQRWVLAYSGGLDSTVLLEALYRHGHPCLVVHVQHSLDAADQRMAQAAAAQAQQRQMPYQHITLGPLSGNWEESARRERYRALLSAAGTDPLLLAHHRDDVAETVLFRLFRGSGPLGIGSPSRSRAHHRLLLRPLLGFAKSDLARSAQRHQLHWFEDPSNLELNHDRNFLRHRLWPVTAERWPQAQLQVARFASHLAQENALLDELAAPSVARLIHNDALAVEAMLASCSTPLSLYLVRYFCRQLSLPLPSSARLEAWLRQWQARPQLWQESLGGNVLELYRGHLRSEPALVPLPSTQSWSAPQSAVSWALNPLQFGPAQADGLDLSRGDISISTRTEGARLYWRGHHHSLKKIFQEHHISPYWRRIWPLLWCDDTLIALPSLASDERFSAEVGWKVTWR